MEENIRKNAPEYMFETVEKIGKRHLIKSVINLLIAFFLMFASIGCIQAFTELFKPIIEFSQGEIIYLAAGFAIYFPLHFLFRKHIIFHIFGHELTHALWAMLFGARVEEFYASQRAGGFVTYTRENFLILLAPYFFPLYAICFNFLYHVSKSPYDKIFLFLTGFSLGFHLLLTMWSIKVGQTDIKRTGIIFSLSFIFLMNVLVYGMLICSVQENQTVIGFLDSAFRNTMENGKIIFNAVVARARFI